MRTNSSTVPLRDGTGEAAVAAVVGGEARREPERAGAHRVGDDHAHRLDLLGARFALVALVAHDEQAHRAVADVAAEVQDRAGVLDQLQVLVEGLEVPDDPGLEHALRHVFDRVQRADDRAPVLGSRRRDREAAVAGDHRRDAVPARRRQRGVPEHLRVVVGVDVDEAGGDDVPARRR